MSKFSPLHHLPRKTTFLLWIYSSQCLFYQISLLKSTVSSKIALSHRACAKGGFTFFIAYDFLKEKANEPGPCSPIPDRSSVFLVTPSILQGQSPIMESNTGVLSVNIRVFPHLHHHVFPLISKVPFYLPQQLQHSRPDLSVLLICYSIGWVPSTLMKNCALWYPSYLTKFPISLSKRLIYKYLIVNLQLPHTFYLEVWFLKILEHS